MKQHRMRKLVWAGLLTAALLCGVMASALAADRPQPPAAPAVDLSAGEVDIMDGDVPLGALPTLDVTSTAPSGPSPLLVIAFLALAAAPLLSLRSELVRRKKNTH